MKPNLKRIYDCLFRRYGPQHWWPADSRFEVILGAILTQNTSWRNVEKALTQLRLRGLLSYHALSRMSAAEIAPWLRSSGYYNQKAQRVRVLLDYLEQRYQGSLSIMSRQQTGVLRQELLDLKGFGPETVDSILLYAFDRAVFVVDAYTRRVFSRHGLCPEPISYNGLQQWIQANIPAEVPYYNEFHALLVVLAKEHCRSKPGCSGCPLEPLLGLPAEKPKNIVAVKQVETT
jgi:endonuclease III related protein